MRLFSEKGFTLLEILIVILIVGIFSSLAVFSYIKIVEDSRSKLCQSNQSSLLRAATLYATLENSSLKDVGSAEAQIEELFNKEYIAEKAYFKCPSSESTTYDDYEIIYTSGGDVEDVECQVKTSEHKWP